jgi:outer membrane lipoprotein-sorting protein
MSRSNSTRFAALVASGLLVTTAWCQDSSPRTVAELREQVEQSIGQFESVSLQATYTQTRDVNAFTGGEAKLAKGSGRLVYRGDRDRWFLRDDGFTFRMGDANLRPRTQISGFDGQFHYNGNLRRLVLAEAGTRRSARPQGMIWEPLLTYDYLLRSLHRESTVIVLDGQVEGRHVVDMESSFGSEENPYRLLVRFDTERSYLPLWQKLYLGGKLYAENSLEKIQWVPGSQQWYPALINTKYHQKALGIVEQQYVIKKMELPESFDEESFRFDAPQGADVIDRRSNLAWHDDPWWDELMPWLSKELGWPRYKFQSLDDFKSYCEPSIELADAPPIAASAWLGEDPGPWNREERRFSVLYLWGDAASLGDPHPRWTTELGQLAELIEPFGGEVIGIAGDDTDLDELRSTAAELMIRIPFAIDRQGEGNGETHAAFRLKHYFSVLVVDDEGKVRLLDDQPGALMRVIGECIADDELAAINSMLEIDSSMSRREHDAIKAQWIKLRRRTAGRGKVYGQITPPQAATVTLLPEMKMLFGSNPGGYMSFQDHRGQVSIDADPVTGDFEIPSLPRGVYELKVATAKGGADKATVVLEGNSDQVKHSFSVQ